MLKPKYDPPIIVQIATAPPINIHSKKPHLFAIVNDGANRDYVCFWNWNDKVWESLEAIDEVPA